MKSLDCIEAPTFSASAEHLRNECGFFPISCDLFMLSWGIVPNTGPNAEPTSDSPEGSIHNGKPNKDPDTQVAASQVTNGYPSYVLKFGQDIQP